MHLATCCLWNQSRGIKSGKRAGAALQPGGYYCGRKKVRLVCRIIRPRGPQVSLVSCFIADSGVKSDATRISIVRKSLYVTTKLSLRPPPPPGPSLHLRYVVFLPPSGRSVIRIVHAYNAFHGEIRAAYTFDAGPNAVVYHLAGDSAELLALLLRFYPAPPGDSEAARQDFENPLIRICCCSFRFG